MVCCAQYWARHEIDEAGRVGSQLQKVIFVLGALTLCTFLSVEPSTMFGGVMAMLLYAVGLHGAQKRNHKALFVYGAASLCGVICTMLAVLFITFFLLFGGMHHHRASQSVHWSSPMTAVHEHMKDYAYSSMVDKGMMEPTGFVYMNADGDYDFAKAAQADMAMDRFGKHQNNNNNNNNNDNDNNNNNNNDYQIQDLIQNEESHKFHAFHEHNDDDDANSDHSDSDSDSWEHPGGFDQDESNKQISRFDQDESNSDQPMVHHVFAVTPYGYFILSCIIFVALFVFGLKVRSIKLAFQMRRMLLALARERLPTRATMPSTTASSAVPSIVRPPSRSSTPAPARRRDCPRCTYVNVTGAARCAMCDSALPYVAAPANVVAPPRVYTPGNLYPLNQPIN